MKCLLTKFEDAETGASSIRQIDAGSSRLSRAVILAGVTGRLANVRGLLGRNLFDLPRTPNVRLIEDWVSRFAMLIGPRPTAFPIMLAIDQGAPEPYAADWGPHVSIQVARDVDASRGTAGILRDLTRDLGDDEHVLVINASDLAWVWSDAEALALIDRPEDVVISADRDLRPAGPMRVRSGLLKRVPSIGFIDLKEQFLPRCRGVAETFVSRSERRTRGSLRDLRSYLSLVSDERPDDPADAPTSAEPWQPGRSLIETSAKVDAEAILFDSVVLAGAHVDRGAVVVRSLIGPGTYVGPGVEVVDQVLVGGVRKGVNRHVDW